MMDENNNTDHKDKNYELSTEFVYMHDKFKLQLNKLQKEYDEREKNIKEKDIKKSLKRKFDSDEDEDENEDIYKFLRTYKIPKK